MIVALTGTPGTGKSSVSKLLQEEGFQVLGLNEIAQDNGLLLDYDKARDTYEINIDGLNKQIAKIVKKSDSDTIFLEGHVAHLIELVDKVIVLRCHPTELRKRLSVKGWSEDKIRENQEAEAVDSIIIECVESYAQDKIFEIDTTSVTPSNVTKQIIEIINGNAKGFEPGKIDWSEEILKWY